MFDFFARHRRPGARELREVAFVTPSPGVSARCYWIEIEAQQRAMRPSSVRIRVDPGKRRYAGQTTNVERLRITMVHLDGVDPVHFELDGQHVRDVEWPDDRTVWLERAPDGWRVTAKPQAGAKGPHRNGPFKDAFRNQMMFVYGTRGTAEENAWAIAKARFDAETFWYRGNGSIDVIADTEFDATRDPHRNVIVYGNADTVSCWDALLRDSPVQIRRGRVTVGNRTDEGEDLACLFLRPRPGSERACVAVIGGSGVVGMRVTDRLPIFLSGVAYPDVTLLSPRAVQQGLDGVRGAGFFGNDWSVERGEFYFDEQGPR